LRRAEWFLLKNRRPELWQFWTSDQMRGFADMVDLEFAAPRRVPGDGGNTFPWNEFSGKPAPFIRREAGPHAVRCLQGSKTTQLWAAVAAEGVPRPFWWGVNEAPELDFMAWMTQRRILEFCDGLELIDPASLNRHLCTEGRWYFLHRRDCPGLRAVRPLQHRLGFHSTSPYCLWRAMVHGTMSTGMATLHRGGREWTGVYYHQRDWLHACLTTYGHYVQMRGGWAWSVTLVLHAHEFMTMDADGNERTTKVKCSAGAAQQFIADEARHVVIGALIHMVHVPSLERLPAEWYFCTEPLFLPALELHPEDPWAEIQERSVHLQKTKFWMR